MDWVSFGYGAGLLATAWVVWDSRYETLATVWILTQRQAARRLQREVTQRKSADMKVLEASVTSLTNATKALAVSGQRAVETIKSLQEEKVALQAENERLRATDAKWAAYKARSELNRAVAKTALRDAAATAKKPLPVGRGSASAPTPRQPQRLDGLGYAGKPGTVCGRDMCCLSENHDGDCTV